MIDYTLIWDLAIGNVALVPLIIGIISGAKRLGMPVKFAPWLAGALGILGFAIVRFLQVYPEFIETAQYVGSGVLIFLVTSGVYQLSKTDKK